MPNDGGVLVGGAAVPGRVVAGVPVGPPGGVGGADRRPAPVEVEDGVPVPVEPDGVAAGGRLSMRRNDSAAARSVSRAVWAVALVFAPAWSAASAALSAPVRAVAMARSAWIIATCPNTPALPAPALMFSFAATPVRNCSPRLVIRPPRSSTALVSIRVPRPLTDPPVSGVDGGGDAGLPLSPPWCEPRPVRLPAIRRWPAAFRTA
ncbi:hypothetical protein [Saccharothrix obliqua]|uniref:hypothetical protein n=1 Tax=Saccharothrix obliqua TaxID=2861747 RepID=UPI001C5EB89D|nr:hypothetical protein [Saccharothrix obliqua]MBW4717250.1 hypothetical protein [Saccharothrix obliqua]